MKLRSQDLLNLKFIHCFGSEVTTFLQYSRMVFLQYSRMAFLQSSRMAFLQYSRMAWGNDLPAVP